MSRYNRLILILILMSFCLTVPNLASAYTKVGVWVGRTAPTFEEGDDNGYSDILILLKRPHSTAPTVEEYPGIAGGVNIYSHFSSWFGLRSNINFIQKGAKITYHNGTSTEIIKLRYTAFEPSFGPNFQFSPNRLIPAAEGRIPFMLNLHVGGFMSVVPPFSSPKLISKGEEDDYDLSDIDIDVEGSLGVIDFGYFFNYGVEWYTGKTTLTLEFSTIVGSLPVTSIEDDPKVTHKTNMIAVGVKF